MFRKILALLLLVPLFICAQEGMVLRDNLAKAQPGDYIVTMQGKNYTVLLIQAKTYNSLTIQEITTTTSKLKTGQFPSWKKWVEGGAPGSTSWVQYTIDLNNGLLQNFKSLQKTGWTDLPQRENFLTTLLNLKLKKIPIQNRKKFGMDIITGTDDPTRVWQPKMVVEGRQVDGVLFDAWKTEWPNDNTEMSGRTVEIYLPTEEGKYPSYFPYWLQISGTIGKAKVRIIDSGTQLKSPHY
jgi:hypothetical protein